MIEITDTALQAAAAEGMDAFLRAFTDKYREALGGDPTAETISRLNGEQHSLLAYRSFRRRSDRRRVLPPYPERLRGLHLRQPVRQGNAPVGRGTVLETGIRREKIYDAHREDLERERTDEEFMAMYEQYEAFDELEESSAKWKRR